MWCWKPNLVIWKCFCFDIKFMIHKVMILCLEKWEETFTNMILCWRFWSIYSPINPAPHSTGQSALPSAGLKRNSSFFSLRSRMKASWFRRTVSADLGGVGTRHSDWRHFGHAVLSLQTSPQIHELKKTKKQHKQVDLLNPDTKLITEAERRCCPSSTAEGCAAPGTWEEQWWRWWAPTAGRWVCSGTASGGSWRRTEPCRAAGGEQRVSC